jgi:hypothetical protein
MVLRENERPRAPNVYAAEGPEFWGPNPLPWAEGRNSFCWLALDQPTKSIRRASADEEPTGRPLVAVEERAFGSWTIARLCSLRQGGHEKRGKSARREIQVFATFGIVHVEYGDGVQVYISAELFNRRQQAVHEEAPAGVAWLVSQSLGGGYSLDILNS